MPRAAEIVALRRLDTESRGGFERFQPGQHRAKFYGDSAHLTYVDDSGALVLMICDYRDDEFFLASMQCPRVDIRNNIDLVYFPRWFGFNDNLMRALQEAKEAYEDKRRRQEEKQEERRKAQEEEQRKAQEAGAAQGNTGPQTTPGGGGEES